MSFTVAIVGRPNVGKSTLFNVLTGTRDAIVADVPGLTRDRQYGFGRVGPVPYVVIDTGGLIENPTGLEAQMRAQTERAVAEADRLVFLADARAAEGLHVAMLRYFNAAGADPAGDLPERHDPETHLIPLAIDAATRGAPALQIFGSDYPTADGTCERDFIHVCDLAAAHVQALHYLNAGNAALTINLGTGRAASVRSVVAAVERITGRMVPVAHAARRPGDPPVLVADALLARELIGFAPRLSDLDTVVTTAWRARINKNPAPKQA